MDAPSHRVDQYGRSSELDVAELVDEELDGSFIVLLGGHVGVIDLVVDEPFFQAADELQTDPSPAVET